MRQQELLVQRLQPLLERRLWSILSWSCGVTAVTFLLYYMIKFPPTTDSVVGWQFVLHDWPSASISPIHAKPITWFSYFGFLYWAFGLESKRHYLLARGPRTRKILIAITALIAFGAFYEIFFYFSLWGALMSMQDVATLDPDIINVFFESHPELRNPINVVFASKVVVMAFAMSLYSLWYLARLDKEASSRIETI